MGVGGTGVGVEVGVGRTGVGVGGLGVAVGGVRVGVGGSGVAVGGLVPWPQPTAKSRNRPKAMTIVSQPNLRIIVHPLLDCFVVHVDDLR